MVSNEMIEIVAKTMMDELAKRGIRSQNWGSANDRNRQAYREAAREAFKALGVKVEGDDGGEVTF